MSEIERIEREAIEAARKAYCNALYTPSEYAVRAAIASLRANGFDLVQVEPSEEMYESQWGTKGPGQTVFGLPCLPQARNSSKDPKMDNARKVQLVGKVAEAIKAVTIAGQKIRISDYGAALVASAALESVLAEMGWRPIETAPKDGTWILIAGPSGYLSTPLRVSVASFAPHYHHPLHPWQTHSYDAFTDGGEDATHWMPLPAPPKE